MAKLIIRFDKQTDLQEAYNLWNELNPILNKHRSIINEIYVDTLEEEE